MTPVEILKGAKELLTDENKWYKGGAWTNSSEETGYKPTRFCVGGACCNIVGWYDYWKPLSKEGFDALKMVYNYLTAVCSGNFTTFNDDPDTTHADLMAMLDKAIALAEKDASA